MAIVTPFVPESELTRQRISLPAGILRYDLQPPFTGELIGTSGLRLHQLAFQHRAGVTVYVHFVLQCFNKRLRVVSSLASAPSAGTLPTASVRVTRSWHRLPGSFTRVLSSALVFST